MKKFILGVVTGLALAGLAYAGFTFFGGTSGGGPVSPENLNPDVKDFGSLRVEIFGKGSPLADVEVDVGIIGPNGPENFTSMNTDSKGAALFSKLPVGTYDIFFNTNKFAAGYAPPTVRTNVTIIKDQLTQKRIDLDPK